jgi:hypothetical protein
MIKFYKYLFYRFYIWNLRKWGENDDPHWNAMLGISVIIFTNIVLILEVLGRLGVETIFIRPVPKIRIILLMSSIIIFNYYQFIFRDKYKKIVLHYESKPYINKKLGTVLMIIYFPLSIAILWSMAYLFPIFK